MSDILLMYMDGISIQDIASKERTDVGTVLQALRSYKRKEPNNRDYIYIFKEMVVERILRGYAKGEVTKELGVAYRTINKYMEELNADVPMSMKNLESLMFSAIDWKKFHQCPVCLRTDVNDLNIYREEGEYHNHAFCVDCNFEWFSKDGITYQVNWQYLEG